ncbi:kinetochore-associated Ndc80 complex subunit ndc80, partial [Cladochytrium tenue]
LERKIQQFNSLAFRLGLHALSPTETDGVRFELHLNANATSMREMVSEDLQGRLKPVLVKIRSKHNSDLHRSEEELLTLQERLDRLAEALQERSDEIEATSARIRALTDHYNQEKEVR